MIQRYQLVAEIDWILKSKIPLHAAYKKTTLTIKKQIKRGEKSYTTLNQKRAKVATLTKHSSGQGHYQG